MAKQDVDPCCAVVNAEGLVVGVIMASVDDECPPWYEGCRMIPVTVGAVSPGDRYDQASGSFTAPALPSSVSMGEQF